MAPKRRNMFYENKKQETTEIGLHKYLRASLHMYDVLDVCGYDAGYSFTSYSYGTSGAYLGNPNVFIRLDSVDSGSYATIDTCHVKEAAPPSSAVTVSPYATTYVTSDPLTSQVTHHIYSNPQSTVSYSTSHNKQQRVRDNWNVILTMLNDILWDKIIRRWPRDLLVE
ncbi:hypothetical protein AAG570_002620 [Ranatra chinensis]|uniref:Uncharacterized protein n=1 Tax=Ranatra chinensis TaxID=642074 RepID=A0ABD0Y848_9HEMI